MPTEKTWRITGAHVIGRKRILCPHCTLNNVFAFLLYVPSLRSFQYLTKYTLKIIDQLNSLDICYKQKWIKTTQTECLITF